MKPNMISLVSRDDGKTVYFCCKCSRFVDDMMHTCKGIEQSPSLEARNDDRTDSVSSSFDSIVHPRVEKSKT